MTRISKESYDYTMDLYNQLSDAIRKRAGEIQDETRDMDPNQGWNRKHVCGVDPDWTWTYEDTIFDGTVFRVTPSDTYRCEYGCHVDVPVSDILEGEG